MVSPFRGLRFILVAFLALGFSDPDPEDGEQLLWDISRSCGEASEELPECSLSFPDVRACDLAYMASYVALLSAESLSWCLRGWKVGSPTFLTG